MPLKMLVEILKDSLQDSLSLGTAIALRQSTIGLFISGVLLLSSGYSCLATVLLLSSLNSLSFLSKRIAYQVDNSLSLFSFSGSS